MRKTALLPLVFVLLSSQPHAWGQVGEDLYIYGYKQSLFYQRNSVYESFLDGRT